MKKLILLLALALSSYGAVAQTHRGYRGFFDIGHSFVSSKGTSYYEYYDDVEDIHEDAKCINTLSNICMLSTTQGYQFTPNFFLGVGAGISFWKEKWTIISEIYYGDGVSMTDTRLYDIVTGYIETRIDIPTTGRISFFGTNKIGIASLYCTGNYKTNTKKNSLYFAPGFGFRYQLNSRIGLNCCLSYQYYQFHRKEFDEWISPWDDSFKLKDEGFALTIGIDFQ